MNLKDKFLITLGESAGAVLIIGLFSGALWGIIKFFGIRLLKKLGIDYFAEIAESYRWIGQTLIESRAILNADRACYYRTSNGKSYIEDAVIDRNKDIKVYSIVNVVRNKGLNLLPDTLKREFFDWFIKIHSEENYVQYFAQDLDKLSPIRNELKKYDIVAYMSIKIKFDNDLYGVILYTWSDVKSIPRNLISNHNEYLDDIKNSTLIETATIVSRSLKFRLYEIARGKK